MNDISVNQESNYTRLMKATNIQCTSITDGIATLEGGTISNLFDPETSDQIATKYYTDNFTSSGSGGPIGSLQINTGASFTGINGIKYTNSSLQIYNKFVTASGTTTNISITDNVLSGLSNPPNDSYAVNNGYVLSSNLSLGTLSTTSASTSLSASEVVNKYLVRTIVNSSSIIQDILPTSASIRSYINTSSTSGSFSFSFVYYYSGTASNVLLFGNIYPEGNYQYINNPIPVITVTPGSITSFRANITTSGDVNYYIRSTQIFDYAASGAIIRSVGLSTPNFVSTKAITKNSFIIYPVIPTSVSTVGTHTYTYEEIKNKLIIRSGLTANTEDTFDVMTTFIDNSAFSLGSGQIKFTIQNTSLYNLTIGPPTPSVPTGWYYNETFNRTIPPNKNGHFYINYTGSTLILYTIGIYNCSG